MKTPIPDNRVVLAAPRTKIPAMLATANAIHDAMTAAASTFTVPVPSMATLLSLTQAATTAQQATTTRTARGRRDPQPQGDSARPTQRGSNARHGRGR
jgi:hypothetical protein